MATSVSPYTLNSYSDAALRTAKILLVSKGGHNNDIVFATRFPSDYGLNDLKGMISFGASPRASINMALASRAYAFLRNRGYVIPEDVRAICHDVMRHRLGLTYEAEANNITSDEIISNILDKIAVP